MKPLAIAQRWRPFSHLPGAAVLIPGSSIKAEVFPCLLRLAGLEQAVPMPLAQVELAVSGPVEQFTVCQDLERGRLVVSGRTAKGWMRYVLTAVAAGGVQLSAEKVPIGGLPIALAETRALLSAKTAVDLFPADGCSAGVMHQPCSPAVGLELPGTRLSLGSSKSQEGDLIARRLDLAEILPIWYRLGQLTPDRAPLPCTAGTLALLEACRVNIERGKPEQAPLAWLNLFRAGFTGLFVPQLEDSRYQGLCTPWPASDQASSPLVLLTEGARLMQRLFMQQVDAETLILPLLPPCLPCGRFLDISMHRGMRMSFEWTKKTIRRLRLYSGQGGECALRFPASVRSCRLRRHSRDKGERVQATRCWSLDQDGDYFFDNFA